MFGQYERLSGSRKIDRIGRAQTSKLGIEGLVCIFEFLVLQGTEELPGPLLAGCRHASKRCANVEPLNAGAPVGRIGTNGAVDLRARSVLITTTVHFLHDRVDATSSIGA